MKKAELMQAVAIDITDLSCTALVSQQPVITRVNRLERTVVKMARARVVPEIFRLGLKKPTLPGNACNLAVVLKPHLAILAGHHRGAEDSLLPNGCVRRRSTL